LFKSTPPFCLPQPTSKIDKNKNLAINSIKEALKKENICTSDILAGFVTGLILFLLLADFIQPSKYLLWLMKSLTIHWKVGPFELLQALHF